VFLSVVLYLDAQVSKHPWASFGVGSWAKVETVANDGDDAYWKMTKFTLLEVTPKAAIVRIEVRTESGTASKDASFPVPEGKNQADRSHPDTISYKGRQLQCRAYEYDEQHTTVWRCPEVPGFLGMTKTRKTTTTVVDFEAK